MFSLVPNAFVLKVLLHWGHLNFYLAKTIVKEAWGENGSK
jgi:hypothetical protein